MSKKEELHFAHFSSSVPHNDEYFLQNGALLFALYDLFNERCVWFE